MQAPRALPLVILGAVVAAFSLPGCVLTGGAQRGGGGHAAPAVSAPHAGFAAATRGGGPSPASHAGPGTAGRFAPSASLNSRGNQAGRSLFLPPGITSTRPVFYSNSLRRYGEPYSDRRNQRGYGNVGFVTLGYPGFIDPGYGLGYGLGYDPEFLDPTGNPNTVPNGYMSAPDAFPEQRPGIPGSGAPGPDEDGAAFAAQGASAPTPYAAAQELPGPPAPAAAKPAPLREEEIVTIIFKDGRPPELIRNYALTRTTLYITSDRVRTVPLEQVDLPATEKVNREAGVEFELPSKQ